MLSKEVVKEIYIREMKLTNFFPDEDWDKVYEMLVTDEVNKDVLDTEEHLVKFIRENI